MSNFMHITHGREATTQTAAFSASTQTAAFSASSAQIAAPFGTQTYQLCLAANAACHYRVGNGALTATTADPFLPANVLKYLPVSPGMSLAAVQAATNGLVTATNGTIWVTELG